MTLKVAIILTTRGNFGKMLSTMRAIQAHPDLELQLILGGGILQDAFGDFAPIVADEGFTIDAQVDFLVAESGDLNSMTSSAGQAVTMMGEAFARLQPDIAMVIADRYEALSIAQAALCQTIPVAHLEGGEQSGSIDDRIRHAVSQLADLHLPANPAAAKRLEAMMIPPATIHVVGSPSLDIIAEIELDDLGPLSSFQGTAGSGAKIDHTRPFVLVSQHPVVGEQDSADAQIAETAAAISEIGLPAIWILPNMDAGRTAIRNHLEDNISGGFDVPVRLYPSMPLQVYARAMHACACLIGNSSSGIREATFLGVPTVNIGTRQTGRERGANVIDVPYDRREIAAAIARQLSHGRYPQDLRYGDGHSGDHIAELLAGETSTPRKAATS